jgi:hypothetical protein
MTFPITTAIETLYLDHVVDVIQHDRDPNPYAIEVVACLERALNFAHTGNAKVLQKTLMDPLFLSKGIVDTGLPVLSDIVNLGLISQSKPRIDAVLWPTDRRQRPLVGSIKSHRFRYGQQQAAVRKYGYHMPFTA